MYIPQPLFQFFSTSVPSLAPSNFKSSDLVPWILLSIVGAMGLGSST